MSVKIGGKSFETLADNIYVGDHKVTKIYAGDKLVYPTGDAKPVDRYRFRFWCKFPERVISTDGPEPVDRIGHYYTLTKNDLPIYRGAFYISKDHDTGLYYFKVYFTNVGFTTYDKTIEAIGYGADGDIIKYDYYDNPSIWVYYAMKPVSVYYNNTELVYYTYDTKSGGGILYNATLLDDRYITKVYDGSLEWGGILDTVEMANFRTANSCIEYVLGLRN